MNFLAQIAFLVDSSIQFICTSYSTPEYPFSLRDIYLWSSNFNYNTSIVSLAISGASILVNFSGTCPVVSPSLDNTFIAFQLCYYLARGQILGLFQNWRTRKQWTVINWDSAFSFRMFSRSCMAFIQNKNSWEKVIHSWV